MDNWLVISLREEFYWMITAVTIIAYFRISKDYKGLILTVRLALIFIGITAIMSIIASIIDPLYAREYTASGYDYLQTNKGALIGRLGVGTYSYGQGLICLFPVLIYCYKQQKNILFPKWGLLLYILLLYITIVKMQFFANILISTVVIIVSFLGSKRVSISIAIVFLLLLVVIIVPKEIYTDLLISIGNQFDVGSEYYNKTTDLAGFITTGDVETGITGRRLARYPMLFEAFSKNPMYGNAASDNPEYILSGYHLYWMGKIGATGILGLFLFLYPHIYLIKRWFVQFNKSYFYFATISLLAFFTLGLMKTIAGRDIWTVYLFIIPGLYYLTIIDFDKFLPLNKQKKHTKLRIKRLNYT
jgi:hypothetical protein